MKLSERAKMCREALKLSQEKVAELLGISQPSYQRLEKGEVENPKNLNKLAEIYKTPPEWLKFGTGSPPGYLNMPSAPEGKVPIIAWELVKVWVNNYDLESIVIPFRAGEGRAGDSLKGLEFVSIPEKKNDKQFALRIKDESMVSHIPGHSTFLKGDIIFIDPEYETPLIHL